MKTIVRRLPLKKFWNDKEPVECMVEIDIDEDSIAREIGPKALRNKSGKSRVLGGNIEVRTYPCSKEEQS